MPPTEPTRPTEDPDSGDILASLRGDEVAFARIVHRHQDWVSRMMWRFTRDPATLRELVHDVFVEVFFSLPGYRAKGSFPGWIRTIATRVGYRFWKQQSRDRRLQPIEETSVALLPHVEAPTPDESGEALFRLMKHLPAEERVILTLHYFDELEMKEIARVLGWTVTYVKVRAHRARRKLRQWFERSEGDRT